MKTLILFIDDDETIAVPYYIKALEMKGFEVKQCITPDTALEFVQKAKGKIKLIILDVMIPHGKTLSSKETNEGLITGILFYDKILEFCPDIPIIILTNIPSVDEKFKDFHDRNIPVHTKMKCKPFQLANLVISTLASNNKNDLKSQSDN